MSEKRFLYVSPRDSTIIHIDWYGMHRHAQLQKARREIAQNRFNQAKEVVEAASKLADVLRKFIAPDTKSQFKEGGIPLSPSVIDNTKFHKSGEYVISKNKDCEVCYNPLSEYEIFKGYDVCHYCRL